MFHFNPRLSDIRRLLRTAEELELSSDATQRLKWFSYALEHDGNVSLTCRYFGIARSTFLRWAKRFDARDPSTLDDHSRAPHTIRKPETDENVIAMIRSLRTAHPKMGKEQIQDILTAKHGVEISASTVGRVIARHGFFFADTPSHRAKRAETDDVSSLAHSESPSDASLQDPLPFPFSPEPGLPT